MNSASKIIPLFVLAFYMSQPHAEILKCSGQDSNGLKMAVEYNSDPKNQTLKVNGEMHQIEASTKNKAGVATENFTINDKVNVYDSFIKNGDHKYTLHRFNAMTDETIFKVSLICK